MTVTEPIVALELYVTWANNIMYKQTAGQGLESDIVLIAHNRMCHDHVVLLKTMAIGGMNPPRWRLADSMLMFKISRQAPD